MEQYSKEFWRQCLSMYTMHLSTFLATTIQAHKEHIEAWIEGNRPEVYGDSGWVPTPKDHHRFNYQNKYRTAPPKPKQCDVVVYYRDAIVVGRHPPAGFTAPAGIDVARLVVEPTHPAAATLASLQAKTPGFKLLSITRVVVDDNNDLMEYSTKLDKPDRNVKASLTAHYHNK